MCRRESRVNRVILRHSETGVCVKLTDEYVDNLAQTFSRESIATRMQKIFFPQVDQSPSSLSALKKKYWAIHERDTKFVSLQKVSCSLKRNL